LGCLLVLAILVTEFSGSLIPTMGIVVVAAALFLTPRHTAIVAAAAIFTGVTITIATDASFKQYRIGNVVLASLLGVAVSWAIDLRVKHLARAQQTQARVFEAVPEGLVVLDNDGLVVLANPAMQAYAPGVQQGAPLHRLLGHVLPDGTICAGGCVLDDPRPLSADEPARFYEDERLLGPDGERWIEYNAARVDEVSSVVSLRDVTLIIEAEQDRRALLEAAARQREQTLLLEALGAPHHTRLPDIPGVDLDMWSITAGPDLPSGGDIIDVSHSPDGRVLMLVVDALGSGVMSVRDAWKVLYVSRAHFAAGVPLDQLVARAAQTLATEDEPPRASLLAAVLDPKTGEIDLVTGGHPPALLIHDDGTCQWLEASGRGVGAPHPGSQSMARAQMAPSDSLLLYTDGVVDGTRDLVEGLSNLKASAIALRRRPVHGWAKNLMNAVLTPRQTRGDASLLLVRLSGTPQDGDA
jgi:PAS domain-containing protein